MLSSYSKYHIAYLAGLLDGEGHICAARRPHGRGAAVVVGMTNTDLRLLKPFLVFGGKISKPRIRGFGNKPQYSWTIHSTGAARFLAAVLPHPRRLKNRARIAMIILYNTPRKGQHLTEKQARIIQRAKRRFSAA